MMAFHERGASWQNLPLNGKPGLLHERLNGIPPDAARFPNATDSLASDPQSRLHVAEDWLSRRSTLNHDRRFLAAPTERPWTLLSQEQKTV
jgi:hypothetical protein